MKISIMLAVVTAFIVGVSSFSQVVIGQESDQKAAEVDPFEGDGLDEMPKMVEVYIEMIEVSALEYAEMMSEPIVNDHTAMRGELIKQVKEGKAKLVANQSVVLRPGTKTAVASVTEFIYETEYEPAEYIAPEAVKATTGKNVIERYPVTPPTPTAFDVRNVGLTIEAEAILSRDGKTIDLNVSPELVKHVGNTVMGTWKTAFSESVTKMPVFYTFSVETAVSLKNGQFMKLCTHTPDIDGKPDHSREVIVFVKASVLQLAK